jgi:hypothetical protein
MSAEVDLSVRGRKLAGSGFFSAPPNKEKFFQSIDMERR